MHHNNIPSFLLGEIQALEEMMLECQKRLHHMRLEMEKISNPPAVDTNQLDANLMAVLNRRRATFYKKKK